MEDEQAVAEDTVQIRADASVSNFFLFVVLGLFSLQVVMHIWKKKHIKSFQIITTAGLWLVPTWISLRSGFWRWMGIWLIVSGVCAYVVFLATRKPLDRTTPMWVYGFFYWMYRLSHGLGTISYTLIGLNFFGVTSLLFDPRAVFTFAFLCLFYGLYYGVLIRDVAEICADSMASSLGIDRGGQMSRDPNVCAVCSDALQDEELMATGGENEDEASQRHRIVELECKHRCHEFCLRGWAMVGKKDTCPACKEKVRLRNLFKNPWETESLLWLNLLDGLRYLIVWHPAIIVIMQMSSHMFLHTHTHGPVEAHPIS